MNNQNRRALRRVIYADKYGNWYSHPGTDGTLARNRLARYELVERGDTVSDNEMPDEIRAYVTATGVPPHVMGEWFSHPEAKGERYVRAARGDEPEQLDITPEERIAQLEADLKAADEEARKLREIICDAWRKDADEPEQSALSDEDAQVLEWLRQQRELLLQDESAIYAYRLLRITEDAIDVSFVSELIAEEAANWRDIRYAPPQRQEPTVVCLCGSTRFYEAYQAANFRETMDGKIVLSVGFYQNRAEEKTEHGETVGITPEQKDALDELHLRKIDMADEVLILNVDGYVGDSTRREIIYASLAKKTIRWLEPDKKPDWFVDDTQPSAKADADRLIKRIEKYMRESIARGDGHAIGLKIDVDDYLKRNKENGGDDGDD